MKQILKFGVEIIVYILGEWSIFFILFCNWCLCGRWSCECVLHYYFWVCTTTVWLNAWEKYLRNIRK